jgi:fructose-bisphosphate aldolase class I
MNQTVQNLQQPYKGILAADGTKGIIKRFEDAGLSFTLELDKKYKELLFTTSGLEKYISGVILNDTNIKTGLGEILKEKRIEVGIKVDEGLESFNDNDKEEQITKGLVGLSQRLEEYKKLGATFTKWRAVIKISDIYPSDAFLTETLSRMASYAKLVQDHQMTPIVEPEVLLDGNHTTTRCEEIMTKTLKKLFEILKNDNVDLGNVILKSSMVLPGKDSGVTATTLEVSNTTLRTFKNSVPNEIGGIVFLSGGQTADQATLNLNEIAKLNNDKKFGSWDLTFSFERALQEGVLSVWTGKDENREKAQEVFLDRLQKVSKARMGEL